MRYVYLREPRPQCLATRGGRVSVSSEFNERAARKILSAAVRDRIMVDRAVDLNELSGKVIGAAIEVHKILGPGLLESAYEECLCHELELRSIPYERQKELPIEYKGITLDCGYRLDVVVENKLILELKAAEALEPIHEAQLLTYLKLTGIPLGLLINFNVPVLKQGIKRLAL
jgi:GxxExxY protein